MGGFEETLRRYALPLLENVPLGKLEPSMIEEAYDTAPPGSARYLHAAVCQILRHAPRTRHILWDVGATVRPPKYRPAKRPPVPHEDAGKMLAAFSGGPWFALVALLYATGLRMGEPLALRWSDIDCSVASWGCRAA